MQIGNKTFKPGIIPTIIFLLILPVLLRLGFWQLDRAEEKRGLITQFKQQNKLGPISLTDNLKADYNLNYRTAQVSGRYDSSKQVFIDNKIYQGKLGAYALTPFKINNSEYSILVNRGWVPMAIERTPLPKIETPTEMLTLNGKIKISTAKPFVVGKQFQSNEGWPALMQWINISEIENKSGLKLLPYVFLLDEKEQSGYVREWKPVVMQPEKSTSYAVQWFSLALALTIIYIVVNLKTVKES